MIYLVYADGACSNNGVYGKARATGSFAVYAIKKMHEGIHAEVRSCEPLKHMSGFDVLPPEGGRPTNNLAEASALYTALSWCASSDLLRPGNHLHVCMDSQLILSQVLGVYKTRNKALLGIYKSVHTLFRKVGGAWGVNAEKLVSLHWVPGTVMKASVIGH